MHWFSKVINISIYKYSVSMTLYLYIYSLDLPKRRGITLNNIWFYHQDARWILYYIHLQRDKLGHFFTCV